MTEPISESREPGFEKRSLDWNEAEALLDARRALMEPESRMILKSIRVHDCQDSFEALVEFFGNLDLVEDENTFDSAVRVLDTVYKAFDKIDIDHDDILSKEELENYYEDRMKAAHRDDPEYYFVLQNETAALQWLVRNYGTLQFAKFLRWSKGICRQDLEEALATFKGLKFLQENFEDVSEVVDDGDREVTVPSLLRFLNQSHDYSEDEVKPLEHLCVYIARIESKYPDHHGITFEGLSDLGPEQIWGARAEKLKNEKDTGSRQID